MLIENKTLGQLVDELCTVSQKLWHAQETVCREKDDAIVAAAAKRAQALNVTRTQLIQAIDRSTGQPHTVTDKTYSQVVNKL